MWSCQTNNLFPIQGKNIEHSFSGDRISHDGTAPRVKEMKAKVKIE
jgi:hypothetical protein